MPFYHIQIDDDALLDIQAATDWYNAEVPGLGSRFQEKIIEQIDSLEGNANGYNIRYADVRCMFIKTFPFMVHYTVSDSTMTVNVFAVIHTSRHPKIWEQRNDNK